MEQKKMNESTMARVTTKQIQAIVYGIICDIDDFCKENQIQYYLSGGSVLGAIRHKGFIPWDDDADIMMPRREYERFMDTFPKAFKGKYGVGALSIDPNWNRQWGKIWDLNSTIKYHNYENLDLGIFVDVYPIDGVPRSAIGQKIFYARQKILLELSKESNRRYFHPQNRFKMLRKAVALVARPIGTRFFVERIDRIAKKYDFEKSEYVACSVPVHYGARETIKRELMSQAVLVPFEGKMLPVPVGYDTYLSNLYGDYMTIPKDAEKNGYTHQNDWSVEINAEENNK